MTALISIENAAGVDALLAKVPDQIPEIHRWEDDLRPILAMGKKGRGEAIAQLAKRRGITPSGVRKKFDAYKSDGIVGLINKRFVSDLWDSEKEIGLSEHDKELVKQWCGAYQRKNKTAIEAMLRAWQEQRITDEHRQRGLSVPNTNTPLNPLTGYPMGWSLRNLQNHAPTEYESKAARIGRSAAKEHMPLIYTTRANLYVGQFYLWDDIWHDHEVTDLDQKKIGRPLEFHGLDLKSANKFVWGNRTRVETEFKHEGLKSSDFRFVLAAGLTTTGYHASLGTTLVVENATAAIPESVERILFDATSGMIRVHRGTMEGAAAHAGQYAGRSKGNFRFKAALESLGNLIHNEMAYLPAQVGMDRDHCPEEMNDGGRFVDPKTGHALSRYGRNKYADALMAAFQQLPPERAQWLQWDRCTIQQFRLICEEIYARINRRVKHDLEGWDELYVPNNLGGMRRLSPHEVFQAGRRPLRAINEATQALLIGHEGGEERTVIGNKITVHCGEITGNELRFNAVGILPDREKFLTVINPLDPSRLFCYDAKGAFAAVLPLAGAIDRDDEHALHLAVQEKARREAQLLQPLRIRHAAAAKARADRHEHNANVISGNTPSDREERARLREEAVPIRDFTARPEPAPDSSDRPLSPADFL